LFEEGGGGAAGGFVGSEFVGGEVAGVGVGGFGEGGDGRALAVGGGAGVLELTGAFEAGEVGAGALGLGPGDELGEGEGVEAAEGEGGGVAGVPRVEEGGVVVGVGEEDGGGGKGIRHWATGIRGRRCLCHAFGVPWRGFALRGSGGGVGEGGEEGGCCFARRLALRENFPACQRGEGGSHARACGGTPSARFAGTSPVGDGGGFGTPSLALGASWGGVGESVRCAHSPFLVRGVRGSRGSGGLG